MAEQPAPIDDIPSEVAAPIDFGAGFDASLPDGPPPVSEEQADDAGTWLFKDASGQVLGPVPASVIVDKIEDGSFSAETAIGRKLGAFGLLVERPVFAAHLTKRAEAALAAKRVADAERAASQERMRVHGIRAGGGVAGILAGVVLAFVGATVARAVVPSEADWIAKAPPSVDIQLEDVRVVTAPAARPTEVPATGSQADAVGDEGAKEKPSEVAVATTAGKSRASRRSRRRARRSSRKKPPAAQAQKAPTAKPTSAPEPSPAPSEPKPDDVPKALSRAQIMKPIGGSLGRAWKRCIKVAVSADPEIPGTITVDFVVDNNGRAQEFKLKERSVRSGPLASCMARATAKARWPKSTGERKNVQLPLRWKR